MIRTRSVFAINLKSKSDVSSIYELFSTRRTSTRNEYRRPSHDQEDQEDSEVQPVTFHPRAALRDRKEGQQEPEIDDQEELGEIKEVKNRAPP